VQLSTHAAASMSSTEDRIYQRVGDSEGTVTPPSAIVIGASVAIEVPSAILPASPGLLSAALPAVPVVVHVPPG